MLRDLGFRKYLVAFSCVTSHFDRTGEQSFCVPVMVTGRALRGTK